jgi:hypothetical protein
MAGICCIKGKLYWSLNMEFMVEITFFWDVRDVSILEATCCILLLPWRWTRQIPPRHWYLPTRLPTTIQKTVVFKGG